MMINFDQMPFIYWNESTKISYLQRQVIVHSLLYYELNESVISDKDFDDLSRQLVRMQRNASEDDLMNSQYYYCLKDFDGSTGFYIKSKLNKIDRERLFEIAVVVLRNYKKSKGKLK